MEGEVLGSGNFGRVELATHALTNIKVFILPSELFHDIWFSDANGRTALESLDQGSVLYFLTRLLFMC